MLANGGLSSMVRNSLRSAIVGAVNTRKVRQLCEECLLVLGLLGLQDGGREVDALVIPTLHPSSRTPTP